MHRMKEILRQRYCILCFSSKYLTKYICVFGNVQVLDIMLKMSLATLFTQVFSLLIQFLQDIQEYLNVNGKDILKEYHELQTLTEKMRHKLVNCLVDMLVQRFGVYPKSFEKTTLAKAAIVLFPKFKVEDTQHGTVK